LCNWGLSAFQENPYTLEFVVDAAPPEDEPSLFIAYSHETGVKVQVIP
jgi:hypothetical protein